jgi:hypothetical protein
VDSDPHDEPRDVDERAEFLDEWENVLREPLDSLPAWWGPFVDGSDQQQLGAVECDLGKYEGELGMGLLEFATAGQRRRFLVCEKLSVSRWAGVYIAIDCIADRAVVLKISRHPIDREARLSVIASHPNVVTVHDTFVCQGYPTMVMEWCSQGTLRRYARASQDWKRVLARGLEAGRGLAHFHTRGKVHGDVKPSNILIVDEVGKLADFGIARSETVHGEVMGTPAFAPPERDLGVWTPAGDVYSFAATLCWALEGFQVPRRARALLRAAMADVPERRPTMIELLTDLERVIDPEPIDRELGRSRRWVWFQATAVVVCAAVVTSTVLVGVCSEGETRKTGTEQTIEITLDLAAESVEYGDGEAAVRYLEAARSRARSEFDRNSVRLVADEAVDLGKQLAEQGDAVNANKCWDVAYEVFYDLGDRDRIESLHKTAGRSGPIIPPRQSR